MTSTTPPAPPPPAPIPPTDPLSNLEQNIEHNIRLQQALTGKSPDEIRQYLAANPSFADELVDEFDRTDNSVFLKTLGQLDELALLSGDISGWVVKALEAVNAPRVAGWKRPDKSPRFHHRLTKMADDLREMDKDALASLTSREHGIPAKCLGTGSATGGRCTRQGAGLSPRPWSPTRLDAVGSSGLGDGSGE